MIFFTETIIPPATITRWKARRLDSEMIQCIYIHERLRSRPERSIVFRNKKTEKSLRFPWNSFLFLSRCWWAGAKGNNRVLLGARLRTAPTFAKGNTRYVVRARVSENFRPEGRCTRGRKPSERPNRRCGKWAHPVAVVAAALHNNSGSSLSARPHSSMKTLNFNAKFESQTTHALAQPQRIGPIPERSFIAASINSVTTAAPENLIGSLPLSFSPFVRPLLNFSRLKIATKRPINTGESASWKNPLTRLYVRNNCLLYWRRDLGCY